MGKVIPQPPRAMLRERNRFFSGIAFLVLAAVSIAIWAALIAWIF